MNPLLILLSTILSIHAVGQSTFEVDGRIVELGSTTCKYQFGADFRDTLKLILMDSVITYSNPEKTIIKTVEYSVDKDVQSVRIEYLTIDRKDSIVELFFNGVLSSIYSRTYDSLGRISSYTLKSPIEGNYEFDIHYSYEDSLISTGKITIQSVDHIGDDGFKIYSEYDKNGRKVKETRGTSLNDPSIQSFTYLYNDANELIGDVRYEWESGSDTIWYNKPRKIDLCNNEFKLDYISRDLNKMKSKIRELVAKHKKVVNSGDCPIHSYVYKSEDEHYKVTVGDTVQYMNGFSRVEVVLDF